MASSFSSSTPCTQITPQDALFIVDTQNDFMEAYAIPEGAKPNYDIEPYVHDGKVRAGSLAVANTSAIIEPINEWIRYFNQNGGRVFASLDWHPRNHCSFCRNGTQPTNPGGYKPRGGVCGPLPSYGFNDTGRCQDSVAQDDYKNGSLMQWPDHCLESDFGARFQPFLSIPANATVVKKGWDSTVDTYSAFGGTESLQGYPFDTKDKKPELSARDDLGSLIAKANITRFWTVGIALDFCVGGTVLDALGKNAKTQRPKPESISLVSLVLPCTRAVDPSGSGAEMLQNAIDAGAVVAHYASPVDAIAEVCSQTAPEEA
eukprot:CAMPEP_0170172376 /NCGR_PEP_ID=MMETSP0040_2-20121228/5608_1 /TAXON_ID=641309 /ORGANISM="Lotharella oceanica, Strain CCMP622" /LENGTH=316 /DNA_ID=CAMNT_0010413003 /DNA_START=1 /DNA_END=951 /DNA_ORIENTATION=+